MRDRVTKKLENIFNECLERILLGEDIESCLMSYPEEAAELEPLLRTAFDVGRRASSIQPRPEFKAWARFRLEGAQIYAGQQRHGTRADLFNWRRGWALALTAVLVVLLSSAGTAAASSDALPDETLYPVKLATEQVRIAFAFSDAGKANLHSQLAEDRAWEISVMAREGKTEQVAVVTRRLEEHLNKANFAVRKVERAAIRQFISVPEETAASPEPSVIPESAEDEARDAKQLKGLVEGSASGNVALLEDALENTPEQTRPALQRAIDISKKSYKDVEQETVVEPEARLTPDETEENNTSVR